MSNKKYSTARRLFAHSLPVATMIVTGALALGGCSSASSESHAAKPAADTPVVQSHKGSSLQFLADQMAKKGKYDAAIPLYRRAHALHPRDAGPLFGLGTSLAALGANAEAIEALQAAHDRDDDDPNITAKLADVYLATDRADLALPLYDEALSKDPRNVAALNGKAVALDASGNHQEAQNTYEAGLAAAPDSLKLQSNLGLSMALDGKTDESIQMLENVATDSRAGPSERQNLALAYALAGRNDDAAKVASIDVDPITVNEDLAYYADLKSMSPDERASVMVAGVRAPKQNTDYPANFGYGADEAAAKATIQRVVGKPSVAIAPIEEEKPIQPAVAKVVTAPITEVPPPLGNEGYALQIAAYRKAEQLITGWNILHQRYIDLIGTLSPRRSEVDFGNRDKDPKGFFYRLNAGPLTTYEEAKEICDKIEARGGPCWVRSPEPSEGHLPGQAPTAPARSASTAAPSGDQAAANPADTSAPSSAQPTQANATEPKAKLDVDAVVQAQGENAKPEKSATVWEQVGSSTSAGEAPATAAQGQQQPGDQPQGAPSQAGANSGPANADQFPQEDDSASPVEGDGPQ